MILRAGSEPMKEEDKLRLEVTISPSLQLPAESQHLNKASWPSPHALSHLRTGSHLENYKCGQLNTHEVLQKFGMRDCALAWGPGRGRVPAWLQKWVSLCLAYVELERTLLPAQLLAIPPPLGNFTAETAASQAKGMLPDLQRLSLLASPS